MNEHAIGHKIAALLHDMAAKNVEQGILPHEFATFTVGLGGFLLATFCTEDQLPGLHEHAETVIEANRTLERPDGDHCGRSGDCTASCEQAAEPVNEAMAGNPGDPSPDPGSIPPKAFLELRKKYPKLFGLKDAIGVGDVVRLKSGGPRMTVIDARKDCEVTCKWFCHEATCISSFPPQALEDASKDFAA